MIAKGSGIDTLIREKVNDYKVVNTIYNEDGPSLGVVKLKAEVSFTHSFDGVTAINRFKDTESEL